MATFAILEIPDKPKCAHSVDSKSSILLSKAFHIKNIFCHTFSQSFDYFNFCLQMQLLCSKVEAIRNASGDKTDMDSPPSPSFGVEALRNSEHLESTLEGLKSLRYQAFVDQKPWLNDDGKVIWSKLRIRLAKLVFSQAFETTMGIVIVSNLILIMIEADRDALCYPEYVKNFNECPLRSETSPWIFGLNILLLLLYTVECGLRFFVERSHYWYNAWNMIDLFTVCSGWLSSAMASLINLNLLRLARLVRVVRAVRVFISVPEFYLLITGLYSSIKAILFGSIMLVSVILFWAVLAVELFNPITSTITFPTSCERCSRGFSNVASAGLTFFQQIVAGDSWGTISVPLIEKEPWTGPILFMVIISISLGVMNLILAVIVERATEARDNDHEQRIKKKEAERSKSMVDLAVLCANMDKNNNGLVSLEEMINGYEGMESFRKLLQQMDITPEEMRTIFNVLDSDNSGEVSYLEFCSKLGGFQKRDPVIMHSVVQSAILEVRKLIKDEVVEAMHRHHEEVMGGLHELLRASGLESKPPDPRRISLRGQSKQKAFARSRSRMSSEPTFSLDSTALLDSLAKMEQELQPLLQKAEEIVGSMPHTAESKPKHLSIPVPPLTALQARAPHAPPETKTSESVSQSQTLDQRFQRLCNGFEEQHRKAEALQERLHGILASLEPFRDETTDHEFHRKMFYV